MHGTPYVAPDRRAPQGARGLKSKEPSEVADHFRRAPQGARGLKYLVRNMLNGHEISCPARGTWIEIRIPQQLILTSSVVPRKGHVD